MAFRLANRIYVRNIPWTVGQKEFRDYFSKFGNIARAHVVFDRETGVHQNFGFVQFAGEDGYTNVFKESHHLLEGQYLEIEEQRSVDKKNPNSLGFKA